MRTKLKELTIWNPEFREFVYGCAAESFYHDQHFKETRLPYWLYAPLYIIPAFWQMVLCDLLGHDYEAEEEEVEDDLCRGHALVHVYCRRCGMDPQENHRDYLY